MKIETYKYTTIWNASQDARGLSKLEPPKTNCVRIIVGPTIKSKELATLAKAASSVARVRLVIVGRTNPAWLSLRLFENLFGVNLMDLVSQIWKISSMFRRVSANLNLASMKNLFFL